MTCIWSWDTLSAVFQSYDNDSHVNNILFASHPDAQLVVHLDMNSSIQDESKVCGLPLSPLSLYHFVNCIRFCRLIQKHFHYPVCFSHVLKTILFFWMSREMTNNRIWHPGNITQLNCLPSNRVSLVASFFSWWKAKLLLVIASYLLSLCHLTSKKQSLSENV